MKFDTKVVQSGMTPDPTTGAIVPPIYQTATYVLEEVGKDKGFDYTRSSNPTRQVMEEILACVPMMFTVVFPAISIKSWLIMIFISLMWILPARPILKMQFKPIQN